ncbi:MAG: hypothetical protein ACOYLN_12675 [Blastocatellia bacterium]
MICHQCGREVQVIGTINRTDECPHCRHDLHSCQNCRFFDPGKSKQCRESQADYVKEKGRANFCDYFSPNRDVPLTARGGKQSVKPDDVRSAFDKLFKK